MTDAERVAAAVTDRYEILRELGAGGMATVYLARDRKLDREVALKVLRPELGAVLGSERFLSEIRITARLDHPHILTLIDSGSADGLLYYVMPYARGESLRDRLRRETQLPLDDAVQIAKQVASALDFAHRQGVVHRDLKPENILLQEGEAMLADFGIAIAVREAGGARLTESGLSLGSPGYMSPEQATGDRALDARSDVYSLGAVVFEMISGEPPLTGATAQAMIARLLTETPTPLRVLRASASPEIEAAVAKALAKSPADRFATAGEFAAALRLRETTVAIPRVVRSRGDVLRSRGIAAAAMVATIAGTAFLWRWERARPLELTFDRAEALTSDPGLEIQPDVSPQGNLVTYAAGTLGSMRVHVRPITGGRAVALAEDGAPQQSMPRWSPSGDRVLFVSAGTVAIAPALGGSVRVLVPDRGNGDVTGAAWSPDGAEVAWTQGDSLVVSTVADGSFRTIGTAPELSGCDWSTSGRWIACVSGNSIAVTLTPSFGNAAPSTIVLFPASGGPAHVLAGEGFEHLSPRFVPGEDVLLFLSNRNGPRDLYSIRLSSDGRPLGAPFRLTTGLGAHSIAISRDGSRLAYASYATRANLWSLPLDLRRAMSASPATAREVTVGTQLIESVEVSPDGRSLVFDSNLRGNFDIWRAPVAGGSHEGLTDHSSHEFAGDLSPDGREIAYHSWRTGSRDIEVKSLTSSVATRVTDTGDPRSESYPRWSPSGDAIAFIDQGVGGGIFVVRRRDGGWLSPVEVGRGLSGRPQWSPDGAGLLVASTCMGRSCLVVADVSGSGRIDTVYAPGQRDPGAWLARWTRDGRAIVFKSFDEKARASFYVVPSTGGRARRIISFSDPRWQSARQDFALSATHIFFPVEERESDVQIVAVRRR